MNLDNLTIGEAKAIAAMVSAAPTPSKATTGDGRAVIVRSRDQGVMYGNFAGNDGSTVSLTNAVQMWRWKAKKGGTLADCAEFGVDESGCKFSHGKATVTIFNACALIDCSEVASKSLDSVEGGDFS